MIKTAPLPLLFLLAQAVLGARVLRRFAAGRGGRPIQAAPAPPSLRERVLVVVPVLDERERLAPCLDGLIAQGSEVVEILVVDGGSHDGTRDLVRAYGARDARVRLLDAGLVPDGWNGKVWSLQSGLESGEPAATWVLTVDADVRPASPLARSLLAHARQTGLAALSVATLQDLSGPGQTGLALLHPALLATLVYRLGPPGRVARRVHDVQANGQCFLARREALARCDAFRRARASRCEDMTVARALVAAGCPVGFYEAGDLVSAHMYADWREAWRNWLRSLPLHDQFVGCENLMRLCEVVLVQALPLPLLLLVLVAPCPRGAAKGPALALNGALAALRLGVLAGMARAYRRAPWPYWLSPLCDLPVALGLWASLLRRRHTWRGRALVLAALPGGAL